jgi:hypothetical protein
MGEGMVYNLGEREEGYSNFLWIILLGIFSWLGILPSIASKLLSIIFGTGILILTFNLSQLFKKENSSCSFIALFLLASNTSLVLWVASGMETIFYTFLLLLASYLFLKECEGKGTYLSAFCFLCLALTRPEGILFFSLPVLFRVYDLFLPRPHFSKRSFFIYIMVFSLPFTVYLIWKYLYFGTIIPNTFYAKFHAPLPLLYQPAGKFRRAFHYLTQAFLQYNLVVTIPFFGLLFGTNNVRGEKLTYIVCVILLQIFFVMSVGGDWMPRFRFIVPILPFVYILFQEGINSALVRVKTRFFKLSLCCTILIMGIANFPSSKFEHYEYFKKSDRELKRIREFGGWLKQSFPSHYTVAYEEAGIPMYYSQLRLLDVLGLLNRDIARIWFSCTDEYWEANRGVVDYVLKKRPELIILVSERSPKELKDFYGGVDYTFFYNKNFQKGYELIQVKDWVLPQERESWPEGLYLFVYARKDLQSFHRELAQNRRYIFERVDNSVRKDGRN